MLYGHLLRTIQAGTVCGAALLLCACATPTPSLKAQAELTPTRGNAVTGIVRFAQQGEQVRVSGRIAGLKPGAEHGFHIHEKGDCSSGDGLSAGGHFNPDSKAHGAIHADVHHAGDLPSLRANAQGVAEFDFVAPALSLKPVAANVRGRGLIVHRDPDDFKSQPAGNAGPRLACAVIG